MWEPLQRYSALDPQARQMFWRAAVLFPVVRMSLRLRGYNRTYAFLQRRLGAEARTTSGELHPQVEVQRTCRMVRAAGRYIPAHFTCLEESLTLWYLLRKQGIGSRLRIGVRKTNSKLEAHAWVELDGEALNQPEHLHRHYAAFDKEISEPPPEPT